MRFLTPLFKQTIILNTELPRSRANTCESPWTGLWCLGLLGAGFVSMGLLSLLGYARSGGDEWKSILLGSLGIAPGLYYWLRLCIAHRITLQLIPEWQLQGRLNTNETTLKHMMRQGDVRARFIVDGKRYYSRSDFADIAFLLRAASVPMTAHEVLLRSATEEETASEHLLHPNETEQQGSTRRVGDSETQQAELGYKQLEKVERNDMNRLG